MDRFCWSKEEKEKYKKLSKDGVVPPGCKYCNFTGVAPNEIEIIHPAWNSEMGDGFFCECPECGGSVKHGDCSCPGCIELNHLLEP